MAIESCPSWNLEGLQEEFSPDPEALSLVRRRKTFGRHGTLGTKLTIEWQLKLSHTSCG